MTMEKRWYEKTYRRLLLDMHIDDWDPRFLSQYDPQQFVDAVLTTNARTVTIPANAHTGLCYWPTKVGQEHENVKGKDIMGRTIDLLHQHGLNVIVYYCTIYCDWYWEQHPEARIVDGTGQSPHLLMNNTGNPRRFSVSCMNNGPYRDFVVAQLEELCTNYDFEGVWPDMTFWPTVCYCPSCQQRYAAEIGGEIPRIIDWTDPVWVRFQRQREMWVRDFCNLITDTIKRIKPEATVAHQSQTFAGDWLFGASADLGKAMDWLSSDLYADKHQLSFFAKLFYSLSEKKPFEHFNSWTYPNIHEHVVQRTVDHMKMMAYSAMMNHGAVTYIDAVDPVGTVNCDHYVQAGRVYTEVEPYEPYTGGEPAQDVGIYYSYDSLYDLSENGKSTATKGYNFDPGQVVAGPDSHRRAAVGAAVALMQEHVPFGVITKKNLADLAKHQIVILPNVVTLDAEEIAALKAYVAAGGSLYASKNTSLVSSEGRKQPDFLLADLFGVSYDGELSEVISYVAPAAGQEALFRPFSTQYPSTLRDTQIKVKAHPGAQVLATITLPFTDPKGTPYASTLTDPPGDSTEYPAVVLNHYGKGKVVYAAGKIETWNHDTQRPIFVNLLRMLASRPFTFEAQAPKPVEITLFDQPDDHRLVIHMLNFQDELPNIPISGITVKVWLNGKAPRRVIQLPEGQTVDYTVNDGSVTFTAPRLDNYLMLAVEYAD
jgi:hypothetical protein